jgi:tetratricopeptide (TPR) repeat protein
MNEPHNEYLQLAVETGIPSVILFVVIMIMALVHGWRALKDYSCSEGALLAGILASIIGGLVHAFSSIPFHVVGTFITFFTLLALLTSQTYILNSNKKPKGSAAGKKSKSTAAEKKSKVPTVALEWRVLLFVLVVIFAVVTVGTSLREWRCNFLFKIATNLTSLQKYDRALPFFRRACELSPHSGRLKFYYGSTLVRLGRYKEGIKFLEESKSNFQDIYTYKNLGVAYTALGDLDRAESEYAQWRAMGVGSHNPNNFIAMLKLQQGKFAEAEELFKETLRVRPYDWIAHSTLGKMYLDSKRYEEAVETLYPGRFWQNAEAYILYGVALLQAERYKEAEKNLRRAIRKNPRSVKAHNNLGALYYKIGQTDKAAGEWKKALAIEPDNTIAKQNIAAIKNSDKQQ